MRVTALLLSSILFGQSATDPPVDSGDEARAPAELRSIVQPESSTASAEAPVQHAPSRPERTPPEMTAEALKLPPESLLVGRTMTLVTALGSAVDRPQQLAVVHAYWRLSEAVAVYHFALDYQRELERLSQHGEESTRLRTAHASGAALVDELEVSAVAAQHDLAALALLSADAPLPLPGDCPHAGPYLTRFQELFAARRPPARVRLLDSTLPIRSRAIEQRAQAVLATAEAQREAEDALASGRAELPAVLADMRQGLQQRRAFIESVCRYNHDIADYALTVTGPITDPEVLVGMLIKPTSKAVRSTVSAPESGVRRAGLNQAVPTQARPPEKNEPTLAPPLEKADPPERNEPTLAPSREENESAGSARLEVPFPSETSKAKQWTARRPLVDVQLPSEVPRTAESETPVAAPPRKSDPESVDTPSAPPETLPGGEGEPSGDGLTGYGDLVDMLPGKRAKHLALILHANRSLPEGIGEPLSLEACLASVSSANWETAIDAYWLAGQRAAQYQVLAEQAKLLESLAAVPDDPCAELRLRSAVLSARAAVHDAHVALVESQYELASRLGRSSDALWPIPGTVPHSGPYLLKLDAQARRLVESWPLRRLAAVIPGLGETVQRRAAAVIEAETARSESAVLYNSGSGPIEAVLESIRHRTRQEFAFLRTLTNYNQAIAEYALTVLPPHTRGSRLAGALVVRP